MLTSVVLESTARTSSIVPVILSGGLGTRLWPMSRAAYPKQFLRLTSDFSLLQETLIRLDGLPRLKEAIVVCNAEHRFLVAEQLRAVDQSQSSIILEPHGRGTAPATTTAALLLSATDPDAIMLVLPSDHTIQDCKSFHEAVERAVVAAQAGALVTFGIAPKSPQTGFGYIQRDKEYALLKNCFHVARFTEKPDAVTARAFLSSGDYYWNSGMFVFKAARYLEELKRLCPDILRACTDALEKSRRDLDFLRLGEKEFFACPAQSVDRAIMERTENAVVIPLDIGWGDLGSWDALWHASKQGDNGNVLRGDVVTENTHDTYVNAEDRMVAALGVKDLVIIETADAVLVAHRDEAQNVSNIVRYLQATNRSEHVTHQKVYRPWGYYESIDFGERFQVKRITVKPGGQLSKQMHFHRAEHWVVVSGTAKITRGDEEMLLTENQSTYIPLGVAHRLENPGQIPLHMIEVQSGAYLGEDDIVRIEDLYNRV